MGERKNQALAFWSLWNQGWSWCFYSCFFYLCHLKLHVKIQLLVLLRQYFYFHILLPLWTLAKNCNSIDLLIMTYRSFHLLNYVPFLRHHDFSFLRYIKVKHKQSREEKRRAERELKTTIHQSKIKFSNSPKGTRYCRFCISSSLQKSCFCCLTPILFSWLYTVNTEFENRVRY